MKKYLAEMIGTFVLVLMGCGSAIFAGIGLGTTGYGVTTLGVAMAFGLFCSGYGLHHRQHFEAATSTRPSPSVSGQADA